MKFKRILDKSLIFCSLWEIRARNMANSRAPWDVGRSLVNYFSPPEAPPEEAGGHMSPSHAHEELPDVTHPRRVSCSSESRAQNCPDDLCSHCLEAFLRNLGSWMQPTSPMQATNWSSIRFRDAEHEGKSRTLLPIEFQPFISRQGIISLPIQTSLHRLFRSVIIIWPLSLNFHLSLYSFCLQRGTWTYIRTWETSTAQ